MKKLVCAMITTAILSGTGSAEAKKNDTFNYSVEQFADIQLLRFQVPDFDELTLKQKELVYYLSQATLEGRDILFDQNCKWNLPIRRTLEAICTNYKGDKKNAEFKNAELYLKKVWFANGIHHHYATDKFTPGFSQEFFTNAVTAIDQSMLPLRKGETKAQFLEQIVPVIFDKTVLSKSVNQTDGEDLVLTSAGNYYDGVTQAEAEDFYNKIKKPNDLTPVSHGLNSRLVKRDGVVQEQVYKIGGRYSEALKRIVYWLEKASSVAENSKQKAVIDQLIAFNKSGDLKEFDQYAILWVNDLNSDVDFVNGFTETYGDPLGMKASWEGLVNFKNKKASERSEIISQNAQWFEDNSPVAKQFKKELVKGVSAKVITAAMLGGDCYPATAIGINLPNSNWIRQEHGSKSVTIENITHAYDQASQGSGFTEEFVWSDTERKLLEKYGFYADNMHTDLHECLGHGSGKLLPGVDADALKAYSAPLEETRADLFALYYIADPQMVSLKLMPDKDGYKAEYYRYMLNGLMTQLTRIEPGKNIEQAHMRNRQLIARWVLEKGAADNVVELKERDGKTYVVINNYEKMRKLFGQLLAEVQRIKSEGDYNSGKALIEKYAVKVDPKLHTEILDRYKKLNIAPYKGFVNPVFHLIKDKDGKIADIKLSYNEGYTEQMTRYSKEYSVLPSYND